MFEGTNVTVRVSNPAFDEDFIFRQFATGFSLPKGGNAELLQFANHIHNKFAKKKGYLTVGGLPMDKGEVRLKAKRNSAVELEFRNTPLSLIEKLKTIKINEILDKIPLAGNFKGIQIEFFVLPSNYFTGYSITVKGNTYSFIGGDAIAVNKTPAEYASDLINIDFPDLSRIDLTNNNVIIFDNYQRYSTFDVVNTSLVGMPQIVKEWETVGVYKERLLRDFANNAVNNGHPMCAFPVIYNPSFFDTKAKNYLGFINLYRQNEFYLNTINGFNNPIIPFVKLQYILNKIKEVLGLKGITVLDVPEFGQLIMGNNQDTTELYKDYHSSPNSTTFQLGVLQEIASRVDVLDLNKHVLDISAYDFILKIAKIFNLKINATEEEITLNKKQHDKANIDLTYSAAQSYSIDESASDGFVVRYETDNSESYPFDASFDAVKNGAQDYDYNLGYLIYSMIEIKTSRFEKIKCPASYQKANSTAYGLNNKLAVLRLLNYRDYWSMIGGSDVYPYANCNDYDPYGAQIVGALNLEITGATGIYQQFLRKSIFYYASFRKLKKSVQLPVGLLHRMLNEELYNVYFQHPEGDVSGVIKEISIKADNTRFGFVDAELEVLIL